LCPGDSVAAERLFDHSRVSLGKVWVQGRSAIECSHDLQGVPKGDALIEGLQGAWGVVTPCGAHDTLEGVSSLNAQAHNPPSEKFPTHAVAANEFVSQLES